MGVQNKLPISPRDFPLAEYMLELRPGFLVAISENGRGRTVELPAICCSRQAILSSVALKGVGIEVRMETWGN